MAENLTQLADGRWLIVGDQLHLPYGSIPAVALSPGKAALVVDNSLLSSLPELVRLREALELCMVGGNHLATLLIGSLGASFSSDYPPGSNHEEVRAALALHSDYEAWCCWDAIMRARSALSSDGGEG